MSFLLNSLAGGSFSAEMVIQVLKTIGSVALIVLCVLVVVALCVLFLPVQYRGKGDIEQSDYDVRVSWLFKIIQFRFVYRDKTGGYALYLFGIRTRFLDREFLDRISKRRERRKARKAARAYRSRRKKYRKKHDKYKEQYLREQDLQEQAVFDREPKEDAAKTENTSSDTEKKSVSKVIAGLKKALHIIQVIRDYQPLQIIQRDLKKLLWHCRPRTLKGDLLFGFEDPATTGQALGILSNVYFMYQYDEFAVNGDFECQEAYIKGDFDVKGHVQMIFVLVFILKVIKKKRFRKFLKALKL